MRLVGSAALALFTVLAFAMGVQLLADRYDRVGAYDARVLRPGSTTLELVPIPCAPGLEPQLFQDSQGAGLHATWTDGTAEVLRWTGTELVPGAHAPGTLFNEGPFDAQGRVALDDDVRVERADDGSLTLVIASDARIPVDLPEGYAASAILRAGPRRALVVPGEEDTRTFFLDTTSGAATSGPPTHVGGLGSFGTDGHGTVLFVVTRPVLVVSVARSVEGGVAIALGIAAIVVAVWLFRRGELSLGGVGLGVAFSGLLALLALAGLIYVIYNLRITI